MERRKLADIDMLSYFTSLKQTPERKCPYCDCTHTVLYGKYNGKQRYICKDCKKTFNDFTNTPIARTHFPEKWEAFLKCTIEGLSLKAAAREIGVSYVTLFYWRHKLLSALKMVKQNKMQGKFEIENFFLKFSRKGQKSIEHDEKRVHDKSVSHINITNKKVCVLTVLDLHNNIYSRAVGTGRMYANDIDNFIGKILNNNKKACSRPKQFFALYFKKKNIREINEYLDNSSEAVKYRCDCMEWMYRFRGVATKYLNNYLGLFKFLKSSNFNNTSLAINIFIEEISKINMENTYINMRNAEICFN